MRPRGFLTTSLNSLGPNQQTIPRSAVTTSTGITTPPPNVDETHIWTEDAELTLTSLPYLRDNTDTSVPDGEWVLHVAAQDEVGRIGETDHYTVMIDTTAPYTELEIPDGITAGQTFDVTLSASDHHSGVAETWYSLDGGSWQLGTEATITLGSSTLEYYSIDNAGNVEDTRDVSESEYNYDLTATDASIDLNNYRFSYTLKNEGNISVDSSWDGANMVKIDSSDFQERRWKWHSSALDYLAAGGSTDRYWDLYRTATLASLTSGTYTLEICIDSSDVATSEVDETNNCSTTTFEFTGALPDLTANVDSIDASNYEVIYTLANDGDITVSPLSSGETSFTVTTQSGSTSTTEIYTESIKWSDDPDYESYLTGTTTADPKTYTIDTSSLTTGENYTLTICIDSNNLVSADADTTNNCSQGSFTY